MKYDKDLFELGHGLCFTAFRSQVVSYGQAEQVFLCEPVSMVWPPNLNMPHRDSMYLNMFRVDALVTSHRLIDRDSSCRKIQLTAHPQSESFCDGYERLREVFEVERVSGDWLFGAQANLVEPV